MDPDVAIFIVIGIVVLGILLGPVISGYVAKTKMTKDDNRTAIAMAEAGMEQVVHRHTNYAGKVEQTVLWKKAE